MLKIIEVKNPMELYRKYPGQSDPQAIYIEIDPETETVSMDYSGEIGNALPCAVYQKLILRYNLPKNFVPKSPNVLMQELLPLAEAIINGHTVEWNGSNNVGQLDEDAQDAERELETYLERMPSEEAVQIWDAGDWLSSCRTHGEYGVHYGKHEITAETTDAELAVICKKLHEEADYEGLYVMGLEAYLEEERNFLQ